MSTPYPHIRCWLLSQELITITFQMIYENSQDIKESGALWLGRRTANARVSAVIFPCGRGVEQSPGSWRVGPEVCGIITRWAKPQGLSLLAVLHNHLRGVPTRLSRADREYSVQVPDMLSIVIGDGTRESDYQRWGWYVFEDQSYRVMAIREIGERISLCTDCPLAIQHADADGIWGLA
jgi:hypothetical protein